MIIEKKKEGIILQRAEFSLSPINSFHDSNAGNEIIKPIDLIYNHTFVSVGLELSGSSLLIKPD